jgi:hypothetical protein
MARRPTRPLLILTLWLVSIAIGADSPPAPMRTAIAVCPKSDGRARSASEGTVDTSPRVRGHHTSSAGECLWTERSEPDILRAGLQVAGKVGDLLVSQSHLLGGVVEWHARLTTLHEALVFAVTTVLDIFSTFGTEGAS